MILGFAVCSGVAAVFLWIAVSAWRSEEPVGFFTGVKPPKVREVKKYNHAVAGIWIATAVVTEAMGVLFCFFEQNSPAFLAVVFVAPVFLIGMMIVYTRIEAKYK